MKYFSRRKFWICRDGYLSYSVDSWLIWYKIEIYPECSLQAATGTWAHPSRCWRSGCQGSGPAHGRGERSRAARRGGHHRHRALALRSCFSQDTCPWPPPELWPRAPRSSPAPQPAGSHSQPPWLSGPQGAAGPGCSLARSQYDFSHLQWIAHESCKWRSISQMVMTKSFQ